MNARERAFEKAREAVDKGRNGRGGTGLWVDFETLVEAIADALLDDAVLDTEREMREAAERNLRTLVEMLRGGDLNAPVSGDAIAVRDSIVRTREVRAAVRVWWYARRDFDTNAALIGREAAQRALNDAEATLLKVAL